MGSGYELIFAADGYEALEQIHTHKDDLALILLDLMMPRLSGMDVLKTMKNDEDIRDIPVIVMTADHQSELECLNLGVMDFVPKPYPQWEIVRTRVNKCIELAEDREMIRATERDRLTSLLNIDYFGSTEKREFSHKTTETERNAQATEPACDWRSWQEYSERLLFWQSHPAWT